MGLTPEQQLAVDKSNTNIIVSAGAGSGKTTVLKNLANRILKRVRDFAQVKYDGIITKEVAREALDLMDVDKLGLDHIDR